MMAKRTTLNQGRIRECNRSASDHSKINPALMQRESIHEFSGLTLGTVVGDKSIGMPVAKIVFGLEEVHGFHVLAVLHGVEERQPMADWLAVRLLDGWEVGRRTFCFGSVAIGAPEGSVVEIVV